METVQISSIHPAYNDVKIRNGCSDGGNLISESTMDASMDNLFNEPELSRDKWVEVVQALIYYLSNLAFCWVFSFRSFLDLF